MPGSKHFLTSKPRWPGKDSHQNESCHSKARNISVKYKSKVKEFVFPFVLEMLILRAINGQ